MLIEMTSRVVSRSTQHTFLQSRRALTTLRLVAGGYCVPHPDKGDQGEDAWFMTPRSVGVADGVGGWAAHGVDSGAYARELMSASREHDVESSSRARPLEILHAGYAHVQRRRDLGSATACIASVVDEDIEVANLGDSGMMLLRRDVAGWEIVVRSTEQQHTFNCPLQLGSESADVPDDAQILTVPICEGDLMIVGTDGIFDNLFDHELIALVEEASEAHATRASSGEGADASFDVDALARSVVRASTAVAVDMEIDTPFSENAKNYGYDTKGGKMDDMTVVCALIAPAEER